MTRPVLRDYQHDAITAVHKRFVSGEQRTAVVAATGAGKTVILAELIRQHRENDPRPVLVLAHRSELLDQAAAKLRAAMPGVRVGYIQAGKHHVGAPVIVGSVQTLNPRETRASRARWEKLPDFGMVVVDECHRSMSPAYRKVLEGLGCETTGGPVCVGFTATFTREDKERLTDFYQSVAYSIDILDLIEQGHLVPPRFVRVMVEGLDLSGVRVSRKDGTTDLASTELAEAMERAGAPGVVAASYRKHALDRQGIVFTPSVASAESVAQALRDVGITSEALSGSTPTEKRKRILAEYAAGRLQTVVNCAILGEGFDAPATSCVVIARPTLSKILFRQQVGRGLRPHPESGKTDCLVLDLVGSTGRNNLATLDDVTATRVHVEEGETLTDAVKRERGVAAEIIGDGAVSGSLDSVAVDPWEAERRAKLTRKEREAEDWEEDAEPDDEGPLQPGDRLRYRHVEHRDGWYLRSKAGRWFIPLTTTGRKQVGVVALVAMPNTDPDSPRYGGRIWHVVAAFAGSHAHHAGTCDDVHAAAQRGVELALNLVPEGADRSKSDPDAAWRKRKASWQRVLDAVDMGAEVDDVYYSGQAADWIALWSHGRIADALTL